MPSRRNWRFEVRPVDLVLTVDVTLLAIGLVSALWHIVGLPGRGTRVSIEAGALAAGAFLAWRSRSNRGASRAASPNPVRRVGGLLLVGVGGTLSALAGFAICMALWSVAHAATPARPARGDGEFELALEMAVVLALLLGNAIMYIGALVRSAPAPALPSNN